jgi:hypothetical protein
VQRQDHPLVDIRKHVRDKAEAPQRQIDIAEDGLALVQGHE